MTISINKNDDDDDEHYNDKYHEAIMTRIMTINEGDVKEDNQEAMMGTITMNKGRRTKRKLTET